MKKILVLILTVLMMALFASSTTANNFNVGVDYLASGNETDNLNGHYNFIGYSVNTGYIFEKFKVGLELGKFNYTNGNQCNYDTIDLLAGYKVTKGLYVLLDYSKVNWSTGYYQTANMIGIEYTFQFGNKTSLNCSISDSLLGVTSINSNFKSCLNYELILNYSISKKLDTSLGYKSVTFAYNDGFNFTDVFINAGIKYSF